MYLDSGPELKPGLDRQAGLASVHDWYFPYIPVPDTAVSQYSIDIEDPCNNRTGQVHTDGVTMTDGQTYAVVRGEPDNPICDFTIGMSTPWLTGPRGHIRYAVEHFSRLGIRTIAVGPEASYRDDQGTLSWEIIKKLTSISIANSAHNLHEIYNTVDEVVPSQVSTRNMVTIDESRSAMINQGFAAFARLQGRNVIFSNNTAPVFPKGLDLRTLPNLAAQAVMEPIELLKAISVYTLGRLIHYPETIDPHPFAVAHNIAAIPALLSGETGKLAKLTPKTHNQHITVYKGDASCNVPQWQQILRFHPNARIVPIDGAHTTIAHPITMRHIDDRVFNLIDEIDHVGSMDPAMLDFSKVHLDDGLAPAD